MYSPRIQRKAKIDATDRISRAVGVDYRDLVDCFPNSRLRNSRPSTSRTQNAPPNMHQIQEDLEKQNFVFPRKKKNSKELRIPTETDLPDLDVLLGMSLEELEEDDISSVLLVDDENGTLVPASEIFHPREISELRKKEMDTVEVWDFPQDKLLEDIERMNKLQALSTVYVGTFLPVSVVEEELMVVIEKQQIEEFFKRVYSKLFSLKFVKLVDGSKSTDCHQNCFCKSFYFWAPSMLNRLNPLHVAAGLNLTKFLRAVLLDAETHLYRIDSELKKSCIEHFKAVVRKWSNEIVEGMRPIDLAAEEDHFEAVKVFLEDSNHIKYLMIKHDEEKWKSFGDSCCRNFSFEVNERVHDTFLCKLAYHNRLHQLDPMLLNQLMKITKKDVLYQALKDAISAGSEESIDVILNFNRSLLALNNHLNEDALQTRVGRVMNSRRQYTKDQPMGAMQLICWTNNTRRLFDASTEEKFVKDHFGYHLLVHCLRFENSDLERAIKIFSPEIDKEEFFVVFDHMLMYNKIEVAKNLLVRIMTTHKIFERRKNLDEHYGLPDYISLPLTTALLITEDASIFRDMIGIYKCYMRHDNREMVHEDILRCLQLIQHWSSPPSTYSDQLRLALITMLLPMAIVQQNRRWTKYLDMNSSQKHPDPVAKHIAETYNRNIVCEKLPWLSWEDHLKNAREVVSKWNGTTEIDDKIVNLRKRNRDFVDVKPDIANLKPKVLKSCMKKKANPSDSAEPMSID